LEAGVVHLVTSFEGEKRSSTFWGKKVPPDKILTTPTSKQKESRFTVTVVKSYISDV